jgi:hypothetical protein
MSMLWLLLHRDAAAPDREPGAAIHPYVPRYSNESDPDRTDTQRFGRGVPALCTGHGVAPVAGRSEIKSKGNRT